MKISIITITYNRAHLIAETIQSVLDQSYPDFEHIIIDDGSTDDTEKVVKNFNDNRIRYYKYIKKHKRSFLRNECIRKAKGELISILDSDDLWTKNKLETIHTIFNKNPEINFVIHNLGFIPEGLGTKEAFSDFKEDFYRNILNDLFLNKILPFPIFTIRRESLNEIGLLDENMIDGQHDFYIRVASKFKVYYCAEKLTQMKKHDQNISRNIDMNHYADYLKTMQKLESEGIISRKKHQNLKNKIYTKIAYIYRKQQLYNDAKENYKNAFQTKFLCYNGLKSFVMYLKISLSL